MFCVIAKLVIRGNIIANSAIGSADLALLRNQTHYINDIRLNVFRPSVVTTATVDSTPTDNPASSLTVTGDISGVKIGQRIIITDSSDNIVSYGTVRKAVSGQTLNIAPVSIGDSGYVSPIKRAISATDTVTVYEDFPLWGDYSRIASGTFRKYWDVAYTDENEDAPPIANTGCAQSARVSVGGSADFTLPRSGSNSSFAFGSKTISSYAWVLPTGVTLQGGYALTDAVIGVTATQGQHVISLTVTDSNSKTHTSYVYLFVSDGTNYQDLNDQYTATIDSDTQDINGRTITFTVRGSNIKDQILPASFVHLQHDSSYAGSSLTTGVDVDIFTGYVTGYSYSHNGDFGQAQITAVSPYIYLKSVFMPSQLITEVSNPNKWTEVNSDLSNPQGALCYNRWQSQNLFAMHDIDTNSLTTPRKYSYEYNGKSVSSGLDVAALAITGNVGSASDGTIVLRRNPNYENNTFRNALAVGMTFSADDVIAPLEHPVSVQSPYADIRAGGFAYNGGGRSKIKAWYGTKRWSQGASESVLPDFTITTSEGLDGVLERVGHMAADFQTPDEQPITFNRNINVIDPAYMIWYRLNISSDFDPSGLGWSNTRFLPTRVNRTWDNEAGTVTIQAQMKQETFGQKADQWIPGSGTTVISGGFVADLGLGYLPTNDEFSILSSIALAYNTDGDLAITQNFLDASPVWESLNDYVTGDICDVCYDYDSSYFTSGYALTDPLSVYIASIDGTTLYIYRLFDIKASSFQVDELTTYTMADSSCDTEARIQCSVLTPTLVICCWHDQTGIEFGRSTDGGVTWGSKTNVGSATTDTDNDNVSVGLFVSGNNQIITGFDGTDYHTYIATTAGGSFTKMTNSVANSAPPPMITGDHDTTLYVATDHYEGETGDNSSYTVDFDGGLDPGTLNTSPTGTTSETATGNPDNAGSGTWTSVATRNAIYFEVIPDVGAENVTSVYVNFDYYHDWNAVARPFVSSTTCSFDVRVRVRSTDTVYRYTYSDTGVDVSPATTNGNTFAVPNDQSWQAYETGEMDLGSEFEIDLIEVRLTMTAGQQEVTTSSSMRLDNIKIYLDVAPSAGSATAPKLYKVTTYTTSPVWTDVTPATDYIPELPYGLGVDVVSAANVELAADDDTTPKYFQSSNTASSWTDNGASDYRAVKRIGDAILYGGVSALDLSIDGGTTVSDKTGNLDVVWGSIGTIKNVLVVV